MLHKFEPKIRRMEYRPAFAHLAKGSDARPSVDEADAVTHNEDAGKNARDDVAVLKARVKELEEQLIERDSSFAQTLEAETAAAFARGRMEEASDRTVAIGKIADSMERALDRFAAARDAYLAQVEHEVVRLALSIATRILHREAQMDPLLLSGAVRVALGQLSDTTEVRLRIPAAQHELWSQMVQLMPNLPLRPQLVADGALGAGECALETQLGSVDLGVRAQLAEIERGFFDLLDQRAPAREELKAGTKPEEG